MKTTKNQNELSFLYFLTTEQSQSRLYYHLQDVLIVFLDVMPCSVVPAYEVTLRNVPEDSDLHGHRHDNRCHVHITDSATGSFKLFLN
jgi:hypothetical protein